MHNLTDLQICKHPESHTCDYGACVILSVSAIGAGPLQFKWTKNGKDITDPKCTGTNMPILTIHSFSQAHEGNYTCIVSNNHKTLPSEPATLALGMKYMLCCVLYCLFMCMCY